MLPLCYACINYHAVWRYIFMSEYAQRNDEKRNVLGFLEQQQA